MSAVPTCWPLPLSRTMATSSQHLQELKSNYSLKNVHPTGKKIGHGAYGYVEEVEVNGAICAAKKVHRVLLHHRNDGVENFKQKFFSECVIMSKLRHPHVVQFLGVYFPSDDQRRSEELLEASVGSTPPTHPQGLMLPWLIMELLPTNLDKFLNCEEDCLIPYSVKTSLLLDISRGISYLHSQTPTIIHRDLTAKNILINSALVAKIADFGVARIMCNTMSVGPGTIVYMPPEVHLSEGNEEGNHAHYFTSIDIFSFGVIILYTIIQEYPLNLKAATHPDPMKPGGLIAVSEVDRRDKYFAKAYSLLTDITAPEFELIGLAKRCLDNEAKNRPSIQDLLSELKSLREKISDVLQEKNKFQLMQMARANRGPMESDNTLRAAQDNRRLSAKVQSLEVEKQHLNVCIQRLEAEKNLSGLDKQRLEEENRRGVDERRRLEASLVHKDQELSIQVAMEIANERRRRADFEAMQQDLENSLRHKTLQADHLEQRLVIEEQMSEDRKQAIELLEQQVLELQSQLLELQSVTPGATGTHREQTSGEDRERGRLKITIESLKQQIMQRDIQLTALKTEAQLLRDELVCKAEVNQDTIERLNKEVQALRRVAPSNTSLPPSLPESGIKVNIPLYWKKCLPSPSSVHCGQCVLYGSSILYGGGAGIGDNKRRIVRFDLLKSKWEEFSLYLYEYFSMGVVLGKLLVVGGYDAVRDEYSNRLSEWREVGCNWVRIQGSPLPAPRADAVVLGYKKWLIVAGGFCNSPLDRVDILDCESFGQWHTLNPPLPEPAYGLQSAFYQDASSGVALWYLVSTSRGCGLSRRKPVFFISLTHLIERRGTWAVLPEPPLCNPGVVTVSGYLLAVGGRDEHTCKKDVHMFFPGTNEWLKVSEIQYPRQSCSCVSLSNKKFVVVGGMDEETEYSCRVDQYNITFN